MVSKRTFLWVALVILIVGGYLVYRKLLKPKARLMELEEKKDHGLITPEENQELQVLIQSEYQPESFPLKQWMKGPNVMALQKKLNTASRCQNKGNKTCNNKPLYPLTADGMFGPCTKKALISCQGIFALNEVDFAEMMNPFVTKPTSRSLNWA